MAIRSSRDHPGRGPLARVVEKLRTVASTLVYREQPGGLSVESRVANRKGRRR